MARQVRKTPEKADYLCTIFSTEIACGGNRTAGYPTAGGLIGRRSGGPEAPEVGPKRIFRTLLPGNLGEGFLLGWTLRLVEIRALFANSAKAKITGSLFPGSNPFDFRLQAM
jgi:hypothetical protein